MNNYDTRFKNKINSFIYAQLKFPKVMKNEFNTSLDFCKDKLQEPIEHDLIFVNIPADILFDRYLTEYPFPNNVEYIPFEFNKDFAEITKCKFTSINHIDLPNESVDIFLSIAGLHHFTPRERLTFYRECRRVLKPDGILIIGDVLKGSKQDAWLNEFVNEYNSNGHNGMFFDDSDKLSLEEAGFHVEIEHKEYTWDFDSIESMCTYCMNLFGLNKINSTSFLQKHLDKYLNYTVNDDLTCQFKWSLVYFKSTTSRV